MPSQATKILKLFIILLIPILIVITTVQLLATDQYLVHRFVNFDGLETLPSRPFNLSKFVKRCTRSIFHHEDLII